MPTGFTPLDLVNAFNSIVTTPITTTYPAVWHSANLDPMSGATVVRLNAADYGIVSEPIATLADFPDGQSDGAILRAFHIMHNLAMRLTRVRIARSLYSYETWNINEGPSQRAALKPGLELYFDIPASMPAVGDLISTTTRDAFLQALYQAVTDRRTDPAYAHLFVTATCHGNCHSSRGRR